MIDIFAPIEGATPIPPDDQKKLVPTWITTRDDLNIAEEDNIVRGLAWARRRRTRASDLASDEFSRALHKAMFGEVWSWAGEYRQELAGIGVPRWQIGQSCAAVFEQFRYWMDQRTFAPDELAVRFHHQLVVVHPFTNGNGRHSRMMADLLIDELGDKAFTWGRGNLQSTGALRRGYLAALRRADEGEIAELLAFARS